MKNISIRLPKDPDDLIDGFTQLEKLRQMIRKYQLVVFLDYDGTLTPISSRPENAFLSDAMRQVLQELSQLVNLTIITGRDKENVERLVNLPNIRYAGDHGFDIDPLNVINLLQEKIKLVEPSIKNIREELDKTLSFIHGVQIEPKKYTTAVHYRHVDLLDETKVIELTEQIMQAYPDLKIVPGKKVLDICPNIDWNKGRALQWIINNTYPDPSQVFIIYMGDDITDESAFLVLPNPGIGILVGNHAGETYADFGLKDPSEVEHFLSELIKVLKDCFKRI